MIFTVEDDPSIRELVVYTLKNTGFEALGLSCGDELFHELTEMIPELILLDIMLPGEDGLTILRRLRSNPQTREIPVIMLTAKGTEFDRVTGLDLGADDYIAKPFGMMEMVSRIRAVLRRVKPESPTLYTSGGVTLNDVSHTVTVSGRDIETTLKEYELLKLLMKNTGSVMTRDVLLENVWGYGFDGETRTVDVHVRSLRQKLGDSAGIIDTVRGVGYIVRKASEGNGSK